VSRTRFVGGDIWPQLENKGRLANLYNERDQGHAQNELERKVSRAGCQFIQIPRSSASVIGISKELTIK
jgi:hypothetical protein